MKKIGIDTPATAIAMIERSTRVPRLTAARVPRSHADRNREQHAGDHQLQRRAHGRGDLLDHLLVGDDRAAEIAVRDAPDVFGELDDDRPVEPELEADRGDGVGLGVRPGDDRGRIRRHDLHQAEAQEQHAQQSRERDQQPMDDLASHNASRGSNRRAVAAICLSSFRHPGLIIRIRRRRTLLHQAASARSRPYDFRCWKRYSFPLGCQTMTIQRCASKCVGTCCMICSRA